MCGIVCSISRRDVVPQLIEGLRRLEYRGYDSAGVAVLDGKGSLQQLRARKRPALKFQPNPAFNFFQSWVVSKN